MCCRRARLRILDGGGELLDLVTQRVEPSVIHVEKRLDELLRSLCPLHLRLCSRHLRLVLLCRTALRRLRLALGRRMGGGLVFGGRRWRELRVGRLKRMEESKAHVGDVVLRIEDLVKQRAHSAAARLQARERDAKRQQAAESGLSPTLRVHFGRVGQVAQRVLHEDGEGLERLLEY